MPVPRLATSGTVTVKSGDLNRTGTLQKVPVDSLPNVYGFNFSNDDSNGILTGPQFANVFAADSHATIKVGQVVIPTLDGSRELTAFRLTFAGGDCFGFWLRSS